MTDALRYKNINTIKACVDFTASDNLERARKSFFVFLCVVILFETVGFHVVEVSPIFVKGKIDRSWVVEIAFWALFVYSFSVYYSAYKKDFYLFSFTNNNESSFFCELNRQDFNQKLKENSALDLVANSSATLKLHDEDKTVLMYQSLSLDFEKVEIEGFDNSKNEYTYIHQPEDMEFYNKVRRIIPPSVRFNYLVYVFPIHLSISIIVSKILSLGFMYYYSIS